MIKCSSRDINLVNVWLWEFCTPNVLTDVVQSEKMSNKLKIILSEISQSRGGHSIYRLSEDMTTFECMKKIGRKTLPKATHFWRLVPAHFAYVCSFVAFFLSQELSQCFELSLNQMICLVWAIQTWYSCNAYGFLVTMSAAAGIACSSSLICKALYHPFIRWKAFLL